MMVSINVDEMKIAIAGDREKLAEAFIWKDSPEGHEYWAAQAYGNAPLDTARLRAMLYEHEERDRRTRHQMMMGLIEADVGHKIAVAKRLDA